MKFRLFIFISIFLLLIIGGFYFYNKDIENIENPMDKIDVNKEKDIKIEDNPKTKNTKPLPERKIKINMNNLEGCDSEIIKCDISGCNKIC